MACHEMNFYDYLTTTFAFVWSGFILIVVLKDLIVLYAKMSHASRGTFDFGLRGFCVTKGAARSRVIYSVLLWCAELVRHPATLTNALHKSS
jgi:hypothetical protein